MTPAARRTLLSLFFLSGVSGLVYQVVWVRAFGNVFGNTVHSASLVMAVFMFGLGVGAWLAGAWADRSAMERPGRLLRLYGYAELAIGVGALLVAFALPKLEVISTALSAYEQGEQGWHTSRWALTWGARP